MALSMALPSLTDLSLDPINRPTNCTCPPSPFPAGLASQLREIGLDDLPIWWCG